MGLAISKSVSALARGFGPALLRGFGVASVMALMACGAATPQVVTAPPFDDALEVMRECQTWDVIAARVVRSEVHGGADDRRIQAELHVLESSSGAMNGRIEVELRVAEGMEMTQGQHYVMPLCKDVQTQVLSWQPYEGEPQAAIEAVLED